VITYHFDNRPPSYPNHMSVRAIERNQMGIESAHVNLIPIERHAAIHDVAADFAQSLFWHITVISPQHTAGLGIKAQTAVVSRRDETGCPH